MQATEDCPKEIFIQEGITIKKIPTKFCPTSANIDHNNVGTLSITEVNGVKTIEWRGCEINETEEGDWSVVDTNRQRSRTKSTGSLNNRQPQVIIPLEALSSFSSHKNTLILMMKNSDDNCIFKFICGSPQYVENFLKSSLPTAFNRKLGAFLIKNSEIDGLERSFAELNIFPDTKQDRIWNLVSNVRQYPYETFMTGLSKLAGVVTSMSQREVEEVLELDDDEVTESVAGLSPQLTLASRPSMLRGPPLTASLWQELINDKNVDGIYKHIFLGGMSPSIRKDVWKYLLGYYAWTSNEEDRLNSRKAKEEIYNRLHTQWSTMTEDQIIRFSLLRDYKSTVEKDVVRTDRNLQYFKDENKENVQKLNDILMCYLMYNFDFGYVQGMNDLLAPILILMDDPIDAFACFIGLMDLMCRNFDHSREGMKEQFQELFHLVQVIIPDLAQHLKRHDFTNMYFCFRWILLWFKREFSLEDIYILWECLFTSSHICRNFHLLVAVAILELHKRDIIDNNYGFNDILKYVNQLEGKLDLQAILVHSTAIYEQLRKTQGLPDHIRDILGFPRNRNFKISESSSSPPQCPQDLEVDFDRAIHGNFL